MDRLARSLRELHGLMDELFDTLDKDGESIDEATAGHCGHTKEKHSDSAAGPVRDGQNPETDRRLDECRRRLADALDREVAELYFAMAAGDKVAIKEEALDCIAVLRRIIETAEADKAETITLHVRPPKRANKEKTVRDLLVEFESTARAVRECFKHFDAKRPHGCPRRRHKHIVNPDW